MKSKYNETNAFLIFVSFFQRVSNDSTIERKKTLFLKKNVNFQKVFFSYDPSAGSPTETLLRLLLPTNKKV